ncbi:HET-domain-containing protein [Nemania sp. FL0916]|nr:HET-domain-containing protein [Nemania sp. FL0916]
MEIYSYRPLRPDEIRVIKLAPAEADAELRCELVHMHQVSEGLFDSTPNYIALSYTWGGDEKTRSIMISDMELPITANLHEALVHLRNTHAPRFIWADAVCITQNDIPERNEQVKKMGQIYSYAAEVVIWLGPREEDVSGAFEYIPLVNSAISEHEEKYVPNYHMLYYPTRRPNVPFIEHTSMVSILALLNRPWFGRTWVIQEAMLAKKATIMCGSLSLSFDVLLRVFEHWYTGAFRRNPGIGVSAPLLGMIQIKAELNNSSASLFKLLSYTTCFDSSDPRDSVFGIMNLVQGDTDLGFEVDYNMTCQALYTRLAGHQITHHKRLEFLSAAGLALSSGDLNLPTWVPDWSKCDLMYRCLYGFDFCAGGTLGTNLRMNDSQGLELSAIFLDTIINVGAEMLVLGDTAGMDTSLGRGDNWFKDIRREIDVQGLFTDLERLTHNLTSYITGENMDHVRLRTSILDFGGMEKSDEWMYEYLSVLESCRIDLSLTFLPVIYSSNTVSPHDCDEISHLNGMKDKYLGFILECTHCRILCSTEKGYLGWAPDIARVGDAVVIVLGAGIPFVVRPVGDGTYKLIGESYIHGVMYGEVCPNVYEEEYITLI